MHSTVIAVDLAKDVFELAIANRNRRIFENRRLTRTQFTKFIVQREPALFVFKACGSAHYRGRTIVGHGHEVRMLPAQYVTPYRRRTKTDRADAEALVEANRCEEIIPVPLRSVEQQQVLQIHALREQWKKTRAQRFVSCRFKGYCISSLASCRCIFLNGDYRCTAR